MRTLEDAIAFAARAHEGQTDKAGEPYILHCLRVMLRVEPGARITAVLHDVVEDAAEARLTTTCVLVVGDFGISLSQGESDALDALTRRPREDYEHYIARVAEDEVATEVKRVDLRDNLSRPDSLPDSLRKRYEKALRQLEPATKDTP